MDFIGDVIEAILKTPFIIVGWLIVGAIAGDLARRIVGSGDRGYFSDLLLGIFGAIVGGFISNFFIDSPDGGLGLVIVNLVVATIGAIILIMIGRALSGNRKVRT